MDIRKAIEEARREFSSGEYYSRMRIQEKLMLIESLLPPEGETRGDQCPKCGPIGCAECSGTGRLSGYRAHANAAKPVPSSEKALEMYKRQYLELENTYWRVDEQVTDELIQRHKAERSAFASSPTPPNKGESN